MNKILKTFSALNSVLILVCFFVVLIFSPFASLASNEDLKRELEEQIRQKEQEIQQYQNSIEGNQQKAKTLNNEIQILEYQIGSIYSEIQQIDLTIQKSTLNINEIDERIDGIENDITKNKKLLGEYIRIIACYDQETLLEVVLKNDQFSDLFDEINALESVQEDIHTVLAAVKELKLQLAEQREKIEGEREEQNQLKSFQLIQKRTVENKQWQKEDLLSKTKGEERLYQQLIQGAQSDIAYIKEQLSMLERYNLTLDEAVQHAIFAASKVGIRPAYLLGVLEAESRLGLNVGTGNWQKDMYQCYRKLGYLTRASREKSAFLQICEELGLNPDLQPVSAEPWYGCGGAVGIAQFMPTTWMAYKDRVAALTGNDPPNPWNHRDAFTAAAIKLSQAGANQRTEIGERTAYAKYLGGSRYQRWIWHRVTTYVINLADNFQKQYFE